MSGDRQRSTRESDELFPGVSSWGVSHLIEAAHSKHVVLFLMIIYRKEHLWLQHSTTDDDDERDQCRLSQMLSLHLFCLFFSVLARTIRKHYQSEPSQIKSDLIEIFNNVNDAAT